MCPREFSRQLHGPNEKKKYPEAKKRHLYPTSMHFNGHLFQPLELMQACLTIFTQKA